MEEVYGGIDKLTMKSACATLYRCVCCAVVV
jgi:hypothetical protein